MSASIAFTSEGPVKLEPGQLLSLTVVTTPPADYEVNFRLIGESLDASLSLARGVADAKGAVNFALRAPTQATTFAVRASIKDGPSADLLILVSEQGFSTLHVIPNYEGGRAVDSWVAHAAPGVTCASLADTLPDDPEGALGVVGTAEKPLFLTDAPVGPYFAVVVRAGRFAWGCSDLTDLTPGTIREVEVHVINKPLDTTVNTLGLVLELTPEPSGWAKLLDEPRAAMTQTFTSLGSEPQTLLAAMLSNAPALKSFAENHGWLAALEARYALAPTSPAEWLAAWQAMTVEEPPQIRGNLHSLDDAHALFSLEAIGALGSGSTGAPTDYLMTLGVAPNDVLQLGGELFLLPSRYVGAVLEQAVLPGSSDGGAVPQHLATLVGCSELGFTVAPDCNADCVAALCATGLKNLWNEALDVSASANKAASLPLKASGKASFDDDAALTGFNGSWLGQVQCGVDTIKVSGDAKAIVAVPVPPK